MDLMIEKWAKILVDYSCNVQKGEWVYLVTNSFEAKPLYDAVRKRIIQKRAYPSDHFCYDPFGVSSVGRQDYAFLKYASPGQLTNFPEFKFNEIKRMDAVIIIIADTNVNEFSNISSQRISVLAKTLDPLTEERLRKKWVATVYPTSALAQKAEMAIVEFEEFIYDALFVNKKDSISEWKELSRYQQKLVDIINAGSIVRICGNETDLLLSISERKAESCFGRHNMPDGEVFICPLEKSVNGKIFFGDFPALFLGKEVRDIRLEFKDGKVIKASAEKGEEFLQVLLNTDEGARYIGELGIGTNFGIKQFIGEMLFDEKIGGTIHLALGDSFEECGGKNKSAIHWDLLKDLRKEGVIYIDDRKLIIKKDYIGLE